MHVQSLALDPKSPATLFAGTSNGGIYKTQDGGVHWTAASNGMFGTGYVAAIAIDYSSNDVYAGTDSGIFGTQDGGVTWRHLKGIPYTNALVIDPQTPGTLYEGSGNPPVAGGSLFKSEDYGVTWVSAAQGLRNAIILAVAAGADRIYVCSQTIIYGSSGGEASWLPLLLTVTLWETLAVDPVTPSTIYAGGAAGVRKTMDAGTTWRSVSSGLANLSVLTLAIDPVSPLTVYAGTPRGVFKSADGGETWASATGGLPTTNVIALAVDRTTPAMVYAGTLAGLFKSSNAGGTWVFLGTGLPKGGVFAVQIDAKNPSIMYVGTSAGPYRTKDGGASWQPANSGLENVVVNALSVDLQSGRILAGTDAGVFSSADGGATWESVGAYLPNLTINAMALDSAGRLFVGTNGAGVFALTPYSDPRQPVTVILPRAAQPRAVKPR